MSNIAGRSKLPTHVSHGGRAAAAATEPACTPAADAAAAAAGGRCASGGCQFAANQDYDQGTMGPSSPSTSAQDCCTQCAAAKDCACATYVLVLPGMCWFKNATQCGLPGYNSGATGCWPSGTPPPNPPFVPSCDLGLPYETHGYYQACLRTGSSSV